MANYSNIRALRALIKASLQGIFRTPSAIFFAFAFPLIFILVFGTMGGGSAFRIRVAHAPGSDTATELNFILHQVGVLRWVHADSAKINKLLREGDIVATIDIRRQPLDSVPEYKVIVNGASSEMDKALQLQRIIESVVASQDPKIMKRQAELVKTELHEATVRESRSIDFILPGQLSFSLLASAVFGTAFVFFNLRQTLVLKRFFATPVRKEIIVISEAIARMIFQLLSVVVIIGVGYYVFDFTLFKGWVTFMDMTLICALSIVIFMGFGFIVSSIARNDASIPIMANLIVMPQMLLAGTFFPIEVFPKWLQPFCNALPLSYLNDALRKISFYGAGFWEIRYDILALLIWGVVIYAVSIKTFKWE